MTQTKLKPAIHVDIGGRVLARNTMLNLAGQVLPLLVAVFSTPYVIHHLGPDRYGLYSLASIVVGYFALFNLGIGPATTKYVAEHLGSGEIDRLPQLVWTAVTSQMCLGLAGGILLAAASPLLVERALKIPVSLQPQAHIIFLIMSAALPLDFVAGSFRGVLSASQRFDLLNSIDVPLGALMGLIPVAAIALGYGLPAIVLSLVVLRVASVSVVIVFCFRLHPALRSVSFDFGLIRTLLSFGGWVTVSGAVGPILVYVDDFLIGALLSITAVGYYAPPSGIASKLSILPGCLVSTLFPAFSTSAGRGDSEWIRKTLIRSLKFLILIVGPVTLILVFFAKPLLTFWLGTKFADEGALPLQILAGGVLVNSLALIPCVLLQGVGRPDLNAKFHLLELPIHIALVWFLVTHFGLPGAALAWTLRMTLDFVLLIAGACWVTRISPRLLAGRDLSRSLAALVFLAVGLFVLWSSTHMFLADAAFTLLLSGGFLYAAWRYVLNMEEKWQIRLWLKLAR
jgi:O-antigen/teichoic acid export membrane protein